MKLRWPAPPGRAPLEQVRPGECDHEQWVVPRPVEQVFDEVEQARIRPLHVLEGEHRRIRLGKALEEETPRSEQILPVARLVLRKPQQLAETGLDECTLVRIEDVFGERRPELLSCRAGLLVFRNPAAHANHVRQSPVGDALAVGEAATPVPVDRLGDPIEVLVELPREARLADAGNPRHRNQVCLALVGGRMEELLDPAKLAVTPDEGGLEALRLQRASKARNDAARLPQRDGLLLALELEGPGLLVDDRLLGGAPRRLADVDGAGLGGSLHTRSGVDEVACDHALALGADRDRGLAGQNAGPRPERFLADILAKRRDGGHEIERGPNGPLGIVLGCCGRPPHGHDRVADELLDGAAVERDDPPAGLEVAREQLAHLLRVSRLGQRREPDQVREEHRYEPALGRRRLTRGGSGRRGGRVRSRRQRRAALAAETLSGLVGRPAGLADEPERVAALGAELAPLAVLGAATRTEHRDFKPNPFRLRV